MNANITSIVSRNKETFLTVTTLEHFKQDQKNLTRTFSKSSSIHAESVLLIIGRTMISDSLNKWCGCYR